MDITEKKLENAAMELEITVAKDKIDSEQKKVIAKYQKNAKIDGFRKGKVPTSIVETKFADDIKQETIEAVLNSSYFEALKEKDIHPISYPEIKVISDDLTKEIKYTAKFDLVPTVELADYKGIAAEQKDCSLTDEDVAAEIDKIREDKAVQSPREEGEAVENGDMVNLEIKRIDDIAEEERGTRSYQPFSIVAGKNTEKYHFDPYVIGMKKGEEKEVTLDYPEDYYVKDLAGQKATYFVKIVEASKRILPELDDEFAKDMGEYETLADFQKEVKESIEKYIESRTKAEAVDSIIDQIAEKSKFEIPASAMEMEKNNIFNKMQQRMGFQVKDMNEFITMMGLDRDEFTNKISEEADKSIKTSLILQEIVTKEDLKVEDAEYQDKIKELAGEQPVETVQKYIDENNLRGNIESDMLFDKANKLIFENAKISKSKPVSYKEFSAE